MSARSEVKPPGSSEGASTRLVVLALGSNLGDRGAHLQAAVTGLCTVQSPEDVLGGFPPTASAAGERAVSEPAVSEAGVSEPAVSEPAVSLMSVSPVYETDPVGGPPQPDYFNAIVVGRSSLSARRLLEVALRIEAAAGRERRERWGPRTLDVDLVMCGDEHVLENDLTLPHPRAAERAFVLLPWLAVDPEATLPGRGRVADLVEQLPESDKQALRLRDDVVLRPC